MRMFRNFGALALLGMALTFGATSCSDDDPDYSNVTPPEVAEVHNISGSIAGIDGKGIQGATITMSGTASGTATSDANGYFVFDNVAVGKYSLRVSAAGKIAKETTVEVTNTGNGQNVVWNVMLASEESVTNIEVIKENGGAGTTTTEALEGNDKAEIPVDVSIPANATNKSATIEIAPLYSAEEAVKTRSASAKSMTRAISGNDAMLTGAKISCSDASVQLTSAIDLTFNVDAETATAVKAQKYNNRTGAWEDVPYEVQDGKVVVRADEFTAYGLFLGINFEIKSRNQPLTFTQDTWDNLYGSGDMHVGTASYTYKVGMDVSTSGTTVFTALLIEALARQFGANSYTTQGNYPLNVTLPIGTILKIRGTQQINTVTASAARRSVSGTQYGDVTIIVETANRKHSGGTD